jgi:hypothetical protein
MEGAIYPPTLKTEKKFIKEKILSGTFAIPFKPFLENAEPKNGTKTVVIKCSNEDVEISIDTAKNLILGFSANGKPVENGPIHVYFGDGSNQNNAIMNVKEFIIR